MKPGLWVCFVVPLASLPGCGSILGIDDFHPPSLTGALRDMDNDNIANTKVVFFDESRAKVGETTTDQRGIYELPLTGQLPVNGYFELSDTHYVHTFSHLVTPAVDRAENGHDIMTLTSAGLRTLATMASQPQQVKNWLVIAQVADDQGATAIGAMVTASTQENPSQPLAVCYTKQDETSRPCGGASVGEDGLAWIFDVPENAMVKVSAINTQGGSHMKSVRTETGPGLVFTPVPPVE